MTTQTTTRMASINDNKHGEYRGILGNTRIRPIPDWYRRHLFTSHEQWKARHAETLSALAVPEKRIVLEETCRKAHRLLGALPKYDPEALAATLGDDDVIGVRFDIQRGMDWLRTLDADLATRQIHIERARRQEREVSDVS